MAVQWHPVLEQALAETAVVGVADAVSHHLGRRPTKSEITAARRAARRYAATGQAQLTLLPSAVAGRKYRVLVLARPDVDLDDVQELRQTVTAPARKAVRPHGAGPKDTARRAESLLTSRCPTPPGPPGSCLSTRSNPPTRSSSPKTSPR